MYTILRKIFASIILLLIAFDSFATTVWAVPEFAKYADILARNHIINTEVSSGGYHLSDLVARGEVAKIAVKLSGILPEECKGNIYSDVTPLLGDLCGYIEAAKKAQIVSGLDSSFRVTDPVTRAELVKMLLSAIHIAPSDVSAGFSDVPVSFGDLARYINAGVLEGCVRPGILFHPNAQTTRGEVFKITACILRNKQLSTIDNGWRMVWSDEFNGNTLDTSKWNQETGADGWGNKELQNYTASGNTFVGSGNLTIEVRKEQSGGASYSSARINTHEKVSWMYGKMEARIKLPSGQGIWPAFWMLGENIGTVGYPYSGEMDIAEMLGGKSKDDGSNNETIIYGTIHRPNYDPNPPEAVKSIGASFQNPSPGNWSDDFHTYTIEWDAKTVKHSVDGWVYKTTDISSKTDGFEVFHKPFYIILNVAVGGNWPGPPDGTTVFPQKMTVDWVRVYQK